MFSQIKLLLFVFTILGVGGGYMYVKNLQAENEILTLNNQKLTDAVDEQQAVIEQQLADIEQIQNINADLNKINKGLEKDLQNLSFFTYRHLRRGGEGQKTGCEKPYKSV